MIRNRFFVAVSAAFLAACSFLPGAAEDSVSILPALSDKKIESTRGGVIHHSISGHFAYRRDNWKLILASGSAGWTAPARIKGGPVAQLYDMSADVGETKNLYLEKPELAKSLLTALEKDVTSGRSTDGPASKNDVPVVLWKEKAGGAAPRKKREKKTKK